MRTLICVFFSCFFALAGAETRSKVYVSSSEGNDNNSGSINAPLRSIEAAPRKNVELYLKRGDVFYETLCGFENSLISAYGSGEKPIICGFKILKNPDAWENMGNGVWRLDMRKYENFRGAAKPDKRRMEKLQGFNRVWERICLDNIGFIYDAKNKVLHGRMVRSPDKLERDWDFYVSNCFDPKAIGEDTFRYLFVKLDKNPSENSELHFPVSRHAIFWNKNCEFRDLFVQGFSRHGICHAKNSKFINIDVDMIGGALQLGHLRWARYGNGVEFWISKTPCNNNLVRHCTFSRTYDCGATIQGLKTQDMRNAENIVFSENRFYRCRQAFEHFISPAKYVNCEFSKNLCFEMGNNEFSCPEMRDANILSYEKELQQIKIAGNVFFDANHYCAKFPSNALAENIVYIRRGQYLRYVYNKEKNLIYGTPGAIEEYARQTGDDSSKFIELTPLNYGDIKKKHFSWVEDYKRRINR